MLVHDKMYCLSLLIKFVNFSVKIGKTENISDNTIIYRIIYLKNAEKYIILIDIK